MLPPTAMAVRDWKMVEPLLFATMTQWPFDTNAAAVSMQKRRITSSSKEHTLPLTEDDTQGTRQQRVRSRDSGGATFWAIVIVATLIVLALFVSRSFTEYYQYDDELSRPLPLSEFETVNNALDNANIVALYFAASWCPMSKPVTNLLEEYFSSVPNLLYTSTSGKAFQKKELAIVHVSSDTSQSAMNNYLKPGWIAVPFDSEERTELKKHFSVCAKRELETLEMERKFEIPALIILDGESHGIITTNGVHNLENEGANALDHWIGLQSILRGLQSKYSETI